MVDVRRPEFLFAVPNLADFRRSRRKNLRLRRRIPCDHDGLTTRSAAERDAGRGGLDFPRALAYIGLAELRGA